jgi:predicted 3-demethylubiquinone-9 3-methyltransferase (glyoxalase superfamily)
MMVTCADQREIDAFWDRLQADGGQVVQCGWLTDKFGLSWQVVPQALKHWMQTGKPEQIDHMMQAVMGMVKLDIAVLKKAYDG